ncbi:helix-turn-helix domain-containing protein [Aestuariibacter halophilus]|uniref:Helix-turn-helix domain-containing protein n=1 Tax=Fluctibacter halophilus TaxID=226011 RepID=A0ABS8G928_9ALTE|nr:helix-turn-helix domain-containing protein [Aestuariibacter halophilus]MCC2616611.1 helix-turn-helix domain-containing protein [Aestuariibacter halophilus]
MQADILLSGVHIVDLFFRFSAVGVLLGLLLRLTHQRQYWDMAAIVCSMAYLLLTAPIDNVHYGVLRPPLLLLTDLTTVALFGAYWTHVHGAIRFSALPAWLWCLAALWLAWVCVFFLIFAGRGDYHDIHHVVSFAVLVYVLIDAVRGLADDLVEARRRWRLVVIAGISCYMAVLTLFELTLLGVKDHWLFSLINSAVALCISTVITYRVLHPALKISEAASGSDVRQDNPSPDATSPSQSPLAVRLHKHMAEGAYRQNGLSVSALAEQLDVPAHQLRKVINNELGFDNFTHFINSYRIPAVCEVLKDPSQSGVPILTIALEAGFNSIAPFNRAFKHNMGDTPRAYRDRFQK